MQGSANIFSSAKCAASALAPAGTPQSMQPAPVSSPSKTARSSMDMADGRHHSCTADAGLCSTSCGVSPPALALSMPAGTAVNSETAVTSSSGTPEGAGSGPAGPSTTSQLSSGSLPKISSTQPFVSPSTPNAEIPSCSTFTAALTPAPPLPRGTAGAAGAGSSLSQPPIGAAAKTFESDTSLHQQPYANGVGTSAAAAAGGSRGSGRAGGAAGASEAIASAPGASTPICMSRETSNHVAEGRSHSNTVPPSGQASQAGTDLSFSPQQRQNSSSEAAAATAAAAAAAACGSPGQASDPETQYYVRLARLLMGSGRHAEALPWLEKALLREPTAVDIIHMRGQCLEATGNIPASFATYMLAVSTQPSHVASHVSLAGLYKGRGLLNEALASIVKAVTLAPQDKSICEAHATLLTDIGTRLKTAGDTEGALAQYRAAHAACSTYAPALYNMGVMASEARQLDAALEYYKQAIALEPRYAQAHCNAGVVLREQGRLADAIRAYEAALALAPNLSVVRTNLAIALTDMGTQLKMAGQVAEGIAMYERALSIHPRHADALYNLGVAYGEMGQLQRAAFMYELALAFSPGCAEAHNNLGVVCKEQGLLDKAVECYQAALAIRPNFPQSLNNLGVVMTAQGRAAEALALLTAAVAACPTYAEAHNNLGVLQRDVGVIPDALASYSRALALDAACRNAGQNLLLGLNYMYGGEDAEVCRAHEEWGRRFAAQFVPLPPLGPRSREWHADRPLRVGYISPDLFTHSVSYFAEAPITLHSSARGFTQYVYSCVPRPDTKTQRLQAAVAAAGGVWRDVQGASEADLAALVRQDGIDILVELTGHTANNRLGVMAMRPAPVQVTWIGYPNSTGLRQVDYRITDAVADPPTTTQTFVEELVRLPGCFLCYTPAPDAPPPAPPPCLANGFITFGSFNALAKIRPHVLRVWGRILAAVPRSRLVLKNKPFACEAAKAHFMRQLEEVGVERWRVDLMPLNAGNAEHLATYSLMDLSLDPWPYAGTTTTAESLFMGVPCISLAGRCHAHNVGASLLASLGMADDWVAASEEEYVALAVRHASNVRALAELRSGLRARMLASPLCDGPGFVKQLERVYRGLWGRAVQKYSVERTSTDDVETEAGGTAAAANGDLAGCGGTRLDTVMEQQELQQRQRARSSMNGGSSSSSLSARTSPTLGLSVGAGAGAGVASSPLFPLSTMSSAAAAHDLKALKALSAAASARLPRSGSGVPATPAAPITPPADPNEDKLDGTGGTGGGSSRMGSGVGLASAGHGRSTGNGVGVSHDNGNHFNADDDDGSADMMATSESCAEDDADDDVDDFAHKKEQAPLPSHKYSPAAVAALAAAAAAKDHRGKHGHDVVYTRKHDHTRSRDEGDGEGAAHDSHPHPQGGGGSAHAGNKLGNTTSMHGAAAANGTAGDCAAGGVRAALDSPGPAKKKSSSSSSASGSGSGSGGVGAGSHNNRGSGKHRQ